MKIIILSLMFLPTVVWSQNIVGTWTTVGIMCRTPSGKRGIISDNLPPEVLSIRRQIYANGFMKDTIFMKDCTDEYTGHYQLEKNSSFKYEYTTKPKNPCGVQLTSPSDFKHSIVEGNYWFIAQKYRCEAVNTENSADIEAGVVYGVFRKTLADTL